MSRGRRRTWRAAPTAARREPGRPRGNRTDGASPRDRASPTAHRGDRRHDGVTGSGSVRTVAGTPRRARRSSVDASIAKLRAHRAFRLDALRRAVAYRQHGTNLLDISASIGARGGLRSPAPARCAMRRSMLNRSRHSTAVQDQILLARRQQDDRAGPRPCAAQLRLRPAIEPAHDASDDRRANGQRGPAGDPGCRRPTVRPRARPRPAARPGTRRSGAGARAGASRGRRPAARGSPGAISAWASPSGRRAAWGWACSRGPRPGAPCRSSRTGPPARRPGAGRRRSR